MKCTIKLDAEDLRHVIKKYFKLKGSEDVILRVDGNTVFPNGNLQAEISIERDAAPQEIPF